MKAVLHQARTEHVLVVKIGADELLQKLFIDPAHDDFPSNAPKVPFILTITPAGDKFNYELTFTWTDSAKSS